MICSCFQSTTGTPSCQWSELVSFESRRSPPSLQALSPSGSAGWTAMVLLRHTGRSQPGQPGKQEASLQLFFLKSLDVGLREEERRGRWGRTALLLGQILVLWMWSPNKHSAKVRKQARNAGSQDPPTLIKLDTTLSQIPRGFLCTLKLEKCWWRLCSTKTWENYNSKVITIVSVAMRWA